VPFLSRRVAFERLRRYDDPAALRDFNAVRAELEPHVGALARD
jgi:hypothetical protein